MLQLDSSSVEAIASLGAQQFYCNQPELALRYDASIYAIARTRDEFMFLKMIGGPQTEIWRQISRNSRVLTRALQVLQALAADGGAVCRAVEQRWPVLLLRRTVRFHSGVFRARAAAG